jgi:hypothetical protein
MNRQALRLETTFFPILFSQALSLDGHVDVTAVRLFLIQFREDAGSPHDAVERVLVDQLAMVHLKIAEMYSLAAATSDL